MSHLRANKAKAFSEEDINCVFKRDKKFANFFKEGKASIEVFIGKKYERFENFLRKKRIF